MQSGAFDYITKPVNPEELLMVLKEALNRKTTVLSKQQKSRKSNRLNLLKATAKFQNSFMSMSVWWHLRICRLLFRVKVEQERSMLPNPSIG